MAGLRDTLARLAQLRRRGPDAQHVVAWNPAWRRQSDDAVNALIHARLSIIDPRPEADQPMSNDTGDIWIWRERSTSVAANASMN